MEEPTDKLKSILSDPESLKMIAQIASGFLNNPSVPAQNTATGEQAQTAAVREDSETQDIQPEDTPAIAALPAEQRADPAAAQSGLGAKEAATGGYNDRINLLKSLRPYLNDHKKTRVDGLIKALGTARLIETYTDSNFLGVLGRTLK